MEEGEKDPVTLLNEEASRNFLLQDKKMENYTFYGEYNFIPIPVEKRQIIDESILEINKIVQPTINKLDHDINKADIQDSIYRKISPFVNGFNVCIMNSRDLRDTNFCCDRLINFLQGDARQYTINLLKEF